MPAADIEPTAVFRAEGPNEENAVREVVARAFGDHEVSDLVDALRASPAWEDGLSFVAELDGTIVGQVLFTHGWLDAPQRLVDILVLSPLGVVPERQRRGIGSGLVRHALGVLATRQEPLVILEGVPAFYPRFGFERALDLGLGRPSPRIPEAAFMALRLPSYEPWMTGTVVYPDPFWRTDAVGLRDLAEPSE